MRETERSILKVIFSHNKYAKNEDMTCGFFLWEDKEAETQGGVKNWQGWQMQPVAEPVFQPSLMTPSSIALSTPKQGDIVILSWIHQSVHNGISLGLILILTCSSQRKHLLEDEWKCN